MNNTGKGKIAGLILKAVIITVFLFAIGRIYAQTVNAELVTTTVPEVTPSILEEIERFYEISERSLKIGYNVTLDQDSALQVTIGSKTRHIVVKNFSSDQVNLIFIGQGEVIFNEALKEGEYVIFKADDLNFKFTLNSAEPNQAEISLNLFEQEIPKDVDYLELFDIQVRIAEHEIHRPNDLSAMIEFTNFGEGPTHVRLEYKITSLEGKEYFTGIDEKIVETNEVMEKNFPNLKIPDGQYTLTTTIYYGDNQEATSEETFIIKPIPKTQIIKQPVIFIGIILVAFGLVVFLKKRKNVSISD